MYYLTIFAVGFAWCCAIGAGLGALIDALEDEQ